MLFPCASGEAAKTILVALHPSQPCHVRAPNHFSFLHVQFVVCFLRFDRFSDRDHWIRNAILSNPAFTLTGHRHMSSAHDYAHLSFFHVLYRHLQCFRFHCCFGARRGKHVLSLFAVLQRSLVLRGEARKADAVAICNAPALAPCFIHILL